MRVLLPSSITKFKILKFTFKSFYLFFIFIFFRNWLLLLLILFTVFNAFACSCLSFIRYSSMAGSTAMDSRLKLRLLRKLFEFFWGEKMRRVNAVQKFLIFPPKDLVYFSYIPGIPFYVLPAFFFFSFSNSWNSLGSNFFCPFFFFFFHWIHTMFIFQCLFYSIINIYITTCIHWLFSTYNNYIVNNLFEQ